MVVPAAVDMEGKETVAALLALEEEEAMLEAEVEALELVVDPLLEEL